MRHLSLVLLLLAVCGVWLWFQPSAAAKHYNRGLEAFHRQEWTEAESQFTDALSDARFPKRAEAYRMRAVSRERQSRMAEAMVDHHAAVALDPANVNLRIARGLARAQLGDLEGAIEDYGAALAREPANVQARFNRGVILWGVGRRREAEIDLAEAQRLDPELSSRVATVKAIKDDDQAAGVAHGRP
jgi:tetratricopeptide (TPR) repeat protein